MTLQKFVADCGIVWWLGGRRKGRGRGDLEERKKEGVEGGRKGIDGDGGLE